MEDPISILMYNDTNLPVTFELKSLLFIVLCSDFYSELLHLEWVLKITIQSMLYKHGKYIFKIHLKLEQTSCTPQL